MMAYLMWSTGISVKEALKKLQDTQPDIRWDDTLPLHQLVQPVITHISWLQAVYCKCFTVSCPNSNWHNAIDIIIVNTRLEVWILRCRTTSVPMVESM